MLLTTEQSFQPDYLFSKPGSVYIWPEQVEGSCHLQAGVELLGEQVCRLAGRASPLKVQVETLPLTGKLRIDTCG